MKSFAVCSGKGGAGKTVVSSALATMLSDLGSRVLLIDADYSVAGLTYLTRKERSHLPEDVATFQEVILDPHRAEPFLKTELAGGSESSKTYGLSGRVLLIPSKPDKYTGLRTPVEYSLDRVANNYATLLKLAERHKVDYVIADTRAGLDPVSAAIALSSDDVLVLMEQDRVSWRSSTAFVTNALVLGEMIKKGDIPVDVKTASEFHYLPNKVTRAFARSLEMLGGLPGNVLGGIPLDINFFNRYFRDIFYYSPEGTGWKRTGFYRYLRSSLSRLIPNLPKTPYSIFAELIDTVSLVLFSLSPRITIVLIVFLAYLLITLVFISLRFSVP